jgi:aconitate hydratase
MIENEAQAAVATETADPGLEGVEVQYGDEKFKLHHGDVVIAAITSCTNTSNPSVLIAAGLIAQAAVERGLEVKPWVKTSLAPGSRVVTDYLDEAGLTDDLEALGFQTVGYGCTTCIGNSGPLPEPMARAVEDNDLIVCSILSGNRNFEGRINPHTRANYLASPPLVVAYALAGTTDVDLTQEPLGEDRDGNPVYLKDVWPDADTVRRKVDQVVHADQFTKRYADVETGPEQWQQIAVTGGERYEWNPESTYIQHPPFFESMGLESEPIQPIQGARVLCLFGDSVTTDHISPAGAIKPTQPAGQYLREKGVDRKDFNSFGSRRGNHEVMMRGTFDNIRVRNKLAPGTEGGWTTFFGDGDHHGKVITIYDAAMQYQQQDTPLVVLAGKDYGMGSSRDWAAKGTYLLGVRAVIAESYERIHRSNLVGMGVLPLQFRAGDTAESLGLTGHEVFDVEVDEQLKPQQHVRVTATDPDSGEKTGFTALCRIDTPVEVDYYRNGGILHTVLRQIVKEQKQN